MIAQKETFIKRDVQEHVSVAKRSAVWAAELSVFVFSHWNLDAAVKWPPPTINAEICNEVAPTLNNRFFNTALQVGWPPLVDLTLFCLLEPASVAVLTERDDVPGTVTGRYHDHYLIIYSDIYCSFITGQTASVF